MRTPFAFVHRAAVTSLTPRASVPRDENVRMPAVCTFAWMGRFPVLPHPPGSGERGAALCPTGTVLLVTLTELCLLWSSTSQSRQRAAERQGGQVGAWRRPGYGWPYPADGSGSLRLSSCTNNRKGPWSRAGRRLGEQSRRPGRSGFKF